MSLRFSGTSLEECLNKAAYELNISKEALNYTIIKQEKRFFKKITEIEVDTKENEKIDDNKEEKENIKELCGLSVEEGNIIITTLPNEREKFTIKPTEGIILTVNGQEVNNQIEVTENDVIAYTFEENEAKRNINILTTSNKMEAYITIKYTPKYEYELLETKCTKNMILNKKVKDKTYPPKYTVKEIKEILKNEKISFGIIEEAFKEIENSEDIENLLIAKGKPVVDDIPDSIKFLFKEKNELIDYQNQDKVDYRNRYYIFSVRSGDVIAEIQKGGPGEDGKDIFGNVIKRKSAKALNIKIGQGCILKENKIISTIEGKPSYTGNIFNVNEIYKITDVNLKTGNIDFVGNVEITGSVEEGMEVNCGHDLLVGKNVECAKIKGQGQININGNVLKSDVTTGCENVQTRNYLELLTKLNEYTNTLIALIEQIKEGNLLGQRSDGEIVKILLENKLKPMIRTFKELMEYYENKDEKENDIARFINNRLEGLGPLRIKNAIEELEDFKSLLQIDIENSEASVIEPVDIYMSYSQGSIVQASGNIIVTGKGQYTSELTALNNIEFLSNGAACRGGILCAGSQINLKTVGSIAGISTILKVPKNGIITADIAYSNTTFCFGEKQIILETSSKDVRAYMDKSGDIVIEKFVL